MDNYSEEDDDSYSSEQEASDDAVHGPVSDRMMHTKQTCTFWNSNSTKAYSLNARVVVNHK